jgi:hypothetical protein
MGLSSTIGVIFEINADPSHIPAAMELVREEVETKLAGAFQVSQKAIHDWGSASLAAAKDLAYIGGGVAALGGALFGAAEHAAHFAEEIGHIAQRSGATTEQVSTLRFEADRMNVSTEAVSRGLNFFAKNLDLAATMGKGAAAAAFNDLGIALEDSAGHVRSVASVLPEVIDKLAHMEAGAQKTHDTMAIFGKGGAELIPMLNTLGTQGFAAVTKQADQFGQVVHEKDVIAANDFLLAQRTLNAELQAFALAIGRDVMPWLIQLLIKLENFPLLLQLISLSAQKTAAYLAAIPTVGASLLALPGINKQIAETTKQMDQAITDALVKFHAEAEAAARATKALEDQRHAIHGSGLADDIKEYLLPMLHAAAQGEREFGDAAEDAANRIVAAGRKVIEINKEEEQSETDKGESIAKTMASEIGTFIGAIAGRKAQAEVEGGFYCAMGAFDVARSIYPFNPQLLAKGLGEIGAGIEMLEVAGKSGHPGRGGGAGGLGGEIQAGRGGYGGGYGEAGAERSYGEGAPPAFGLAPGAAGAPSGRLIVHVVGEQEYAAHIAGMINYADQSGYHMQVAVARRSAPAQG